MGEIEKRNKVKWNYISKNFSKIGKEFVEKYVGWYGIRLFFQMVLLYIPIVFNIYHWMLLSTSLRSSIWKICSHFSLCSHFFWPFYFRGSEFECNQGHSNEKPPPKKDWHFSHSSRGKKKAPKNNIIVSFVTLSFKSVFQICRLTTALFEIKNFQLNSSFHRQTFFSSYPGNNRKLF